MRVLMFVCSVLALGSSMVLAQTSSKQVFGSNPNLPFSPAVKADGLIYVSGAIGSGAGAVSGDIKKQTKDTLDNIAATLKTAGTTLEHAVNITVYLRNPADFAGMNEVYATFFPKDPPARTTVIVTQPLAQAAGLVEISAVAVPPGAERRVIHPAGWVKTPAPYSYAIKTGNTLFLAGIISRNGVDNSPVAGDLGAQTRQVMDNIGTILKEAGMGFGDVVQSRVWYNAESNQALNEVYRTYFAGVDPPVRAAVRAGLTAPEYLVEVSMVAVKDPSRKLVTPPNADGTPGRVNPNAVLSPAIQVGNRLYIAGMLGNTATNRGDARAQTTETLARIERALKAAGFDWSHVVDGLVYMPDMSKFQEMNAAYREVFTRDFPARATIGTGLGGDALVEIMFIAVK